MNSQDYHKLAVLGDKLNSGTATKAERDEYMYLLLLNGSITQQQYNDYKAGKNAEEILNAAMAIGAVLLIGYLLKELFK